MPAASRPPPDHTVSERRTAVRALSRCVMHIWRRRAAGLVLALGAAALLILLATRASAPSSHTFRRTPVEVRDDQPGDANQPIRRRSQAGKGSDPPGDTTQRTWIASPPVAFLKTHRTGAGTVQNLLFRLGEREGATFAFPHYTYQFSYPHKFRADFVDELPEGSSQFDLLCSPMRLHLPELRRVMPPNTVYVTVLRDPIATFESIFSTYTSAVPAFRLARAAAEASTPNASTPSASPLEVFLATPERFWDPGRPGNGPARNPMSFDLGLDAQGLNSSSWAADLEALEEAFQLVLIAEHLDESLVLLGSMLGLEADELAYVRLNARSLSHVTPLGAGARARARAWNGLDVRLYDRFLQLLWEKAVRYGGERLRGEVALLRAAAERARRRCVARGGVAPGDLEELLRPRQSDSATVLGYQLRGNLSQQDLGFCVRLVLPERQYHAHLYLQQYGRDMRPTTSTSSSMVET